VADRSVLQLLGLKHTGKSTLGRLWAARHGWDFFDLDEVLESRAGGQRTSRQIYQQEGREGFQRWEAEAARFLGPRLGAGRAVVAWGGGTATNSEAVRELCPHGTLVVLNDRVEVLYDRIMRGGRPAFLSGERPWEDFQRVYSERTAILRALSPWSLDLSGASPEQSLDKLQQLWNSIPD